MNRTEALCKAFGWQGGTIHQIAAETGCDVSGLLYVKVEEPFWDHDYCRGWYCGNQKVFSHNLTVVLPREKGNLAFWIGMAEGIIEDFQQMENYY